jgi:uncharacterized protein YndB with AHSA1/START domain
MGNAEYTVTVDRPAAQVFAYLADGGNNPRWRDGVLEIQRSSGGDGVGATYRQVLRGPAGRRLRGDYRITAYRPPERLEFEVIAGPVRPVGTFTLSARGSGSTSVTFALEHRPKGIARLMEAMVSRQMRHEVRQLDRLKADLEHGR